MRVKIVCTCGYRFESDTWSAPCPKCGETNKPFWERDVEMKKKCSGKKKK